MAISLTDGGIPCQVITPTPDEGSGSVDRYSVSLPIGVMSSVTIPKGVNYTWSLSLAGTCLSLKTNLDKVTNTSGNEISVLTEFSYQITNSMAGSKYLTGPFLFLRIK